MWQRRRTVRLSPFDDDDKKLNRKPTEQANSMTAATKRLKTRHVPVSVAASTNNYAVERMLVCGVRDRAAVSK